MNNIFLKQKRIGIILSIGTLIISLTNFFIFLFFNFEKSQCENSIFYNFLFSLVFSISAFLTSIKNNNISKIYQILIFFIISIYSSILNGPSDITSIVFFIYFLILLWTYYKLKIKTAHLFLISLIFLIFISVLKIFLSDYFLKLISEDSCVLGIENESIKLVIGLIFFISFILMYAFLLWVTLAGELKSEKEKNEKIEKELIQNEEYIWYGKNVVGVIHNIKNKLSPIYLLLEEISENKNIEKEIRDYSLNQITNSNSIIDLLDQLLLIIKNKNTEEIKEINLNKIVLSVVEFFKSNLEFKNNINIKIEKIGEDLFLKTKPFQLVQVIENIIKNSWDELKNKKEEKYITIKIDSINKFLSIKDNGYGIKKCLNCKDKKCFKDCSKFKIGETTKENGLGYGMLFISNYINENNLKGEILSDKNGTEMIIYF